MPPPRVYDFGIDDTKKEETRKTQNTISLNNGQGECADTNTQQNFGEEKKSESERMSS